MSLDQKLEYLRNNTIGRNVFIRVPEFWTEVGDPKVKSLRVKTLIDRTTLNFLTRVHFAYSFMKILLPVEEVSNLSRNIYQILCALMQTRTLKSTQQEA